MTTIEWKKCLVPFLEGFNNTHDTPPYSVVLLNHCFDGLSSASESESLSLFRNVWNNASIRLAVDGGTNRLYNLQLESPGQCSYCDPHFVTGDFDSIHSSVLGHYKQKKGIEVIHTPDQDETDFCKAIGVLLEKHQSARQIVYVFGSFCSRVDQSLSIMSGLFKFAHSAHNSMPIIVTIHLDSSVNFVLAKGKHVIPVNKRSKWCSLVPLAGPVKLSTTGFRWNLDGDTLEFGKFISTSNQFDSQADQVTVDILDRPIMFSFDYKHHKN